MKNSSLYSGQWCHPGPVNHRSNGVLKQGHRHLLSFIKEGHWHLFVLPQKKRAIYFFNFKCVRRSHISLFRLFTTRMPSLANFALRYKWQSRLYLCLATFGLCHFMWRTVCMCSFTNPTALDIIDTAQFHLQVDGVTFDIDHALEALNQGHRMTLNPSIACQPASVNIFLVPSLSTTSQVCRLCATQTPWPGCIP